MYLDPQHWLMRGGTWQGQIFLLAELPDGGEAHGAIQVDVQLGPGQRQRLLGPPRPVELAVVVARHDDALSPRQKIGCL